MNLVALIAYGAVNLSMLLFCLLGRKGRICELPFWMGMFAMGWFFPMAVGGYKNVENYPEHTYAGAMFFAMLCSVALWVGFERAKRGSIPEKSWLNETFNFNSLFKGSAFLCFAGFYFSWKLMNLPDEMRAETQWSGATVKYLFLAGVATVGFYTLWLVYLRKQKLIQPRLLIFILPNMLMLLDTAVVRGRRAAMMNLAALALVGPWFVRRWTMPRGWLILGLSMGLLVVNSVGLYRSIMANEDLSIKERLIQVANSDLTAETKSVSAESGADFLNYMYYWKVIGDDGLFDFGTGHWNGFVFNFVPAQLVGRTIKNSLMIKFDHESPPNIAYQRYGYVARRGTVSTGYRDAFGSFGWFGFIKFLIIGWVMGTLYKHAMVGHFLGQLLYIYLLTDAMHAISHGTNAILVSKWVYFFALGYPVFYFARNKSGFVDDVEGGQYNA